MKLFSRLGIPIIQASVMLTAAINPVHIYAQAPEPVWHVAATRYETDEYIIAGYTASDFNIASDGKTDVTSKIQSALDSLHSIGGGTLFLPEGRYVVKGTLKIPQGVTLAGDWKNPDDNNYKAAGTILMAYSGQGETDINNNRDSDEESLPFIMLEPNSQVMGLNIYYPKQTPDNPVPYPTTIRLYDPKTWGADSTSVRNITFINCYNAIRQGPYSSGCPNINNVFITPLGTAVDMDGLADVGRFTNIHISPEYWLNAELDNAKDYENELRTYIKENAVGIKLGRIDWSYLSFAEVEGCKHGMEFVLSHSTLSYKDGNLDNEMTAWSYPNGQSYQIDISDCNIGLYSEGNSGAGELLAELNISDCDTGIQVVDGEKSDNGNLEIANSYISGTENAIDYNGLGRMSIGNSVLDGKVSITNGEVSIAGCEYKNCSEISLDKNVEKVILGSSKTLPKLDNSSSATVTYTDKEYIMPDVKELTEEPQRITKPAKDDIFVVTDEPYNAPHSEVKFTEFNTPCEEDASAAIQKALDDAEANGGGMVFCPPGRYTINSPLHVAPGVELRGAVNISRIPLKIGTVFDTPSSESEYVHTDFSDLNTKTVNNIGNVPSGNDLFGEVPSPIINDDGSIDRSIAVTPYGLRLYSAAAAEQAHAFDHSTLLKCGTPESKYIMEAIVSPNSLKKNGEFFITLSRNDTSSGKNSPRDAFRIVNIKENGNVIELPGNVKASLVANSMYLFRWEIDLTDINNKTISTTMAVASGSKKGEIYTSTARFPDTHQGNTDDTGHILLQASKTDSAKYETGGESEVIVHGISMRRAAIGNGEAWVQLKNNSGLSGIVFNCANQKYFPSPLPSPYMVQGQGENIYVRNVALRNVYDGIDFATYECNNHYIDGVAGIAWHNEISVANAENGIISNSQFNWGALLYGSQSKLGCWEDSPINDYTDENGNTVNPRSTLHNAYMEKFMAINLDCMTIDNCKNELLYNNFSIFGSTSLLIKGDTDALCVGQGADGSRFGMRVADSADVDFINTQVVSFFYSDSSHITTDEGYNGNCDFLNMSAWSTPASNLNISGGTINIYNPTFNGGGKNVFADLSNDSEVLVQSGWINNSGTKEIISGDGIIRFRDNFFAKVMELPAEPTPEPTAEPTPEPPKNDEILLSTDSSGIATAECILRTPHDTPYTAILAIYDKPGKLVYVSSQSNPESNRVIFENIILPSSDCTVSLFRWDNISGMAPIAEPVSCEYN